MENEIIIKQSKSDDTVTFQAKGEVEFLEHITRVVLNDLNNNNLENKEPLTKGYDPLKGYIGETLEVENGKSNVPDHFLTGIKEDGGVKKYKCRYICPNCGAKENKYIQKYNEYISCRICNERLSVTWLEDEYTVDHDNYQNFSYAGNFKPFLDKE